MMADQLYADDDAMAWLEARGLETETIVERQLGYRTKDDPERQWRHTIAIPYFDAQGRWRVTRYRHLRANPVAKYQTPKGGGVNLYNVAAVDAPTVAICEGEFDSLILHQMGIPSVALPGINNWQREWRWLFRNSDLVYVVVDNAPEDEEHADARSAEERARNQILAQVGMLVDVERIELPPGSDVTDLFLSDPRALEDLFL